MNPAHPGRPTEREVLSLFPIPFYTATRIYFEGDLVELGIANALDRFPEDTAAAVMDQARVLAAVKPELAFHFLLQSPLLVDIVEVRNWKAFTATVLDIYDSQGLNPAREFLRNPREHPLFTRCTGKGIPLSDMTGILLNYLRALGKEDIGLERGPDGFTDTQTIHLPERADASLRETVSLLFYKVLLTYMYAQIRLGTYRFTLESVSGLAGRLKELHRQRPPAGLTSDLSLFFHLFPDPVLARDLFLLADTVRIETWMAKELPGLFRRLSKVKTDPGLRRPRPSTLSPRSRWVADLVDGWLNGSPCEAWTRLPGPAGAEVVRAVRRVASPGASVKEAAETAAFLYGLAERTGGDYQEGAARIPYAGELRPEEAEKGRRRRRESLRLGFRQELAKLVGELPDCEEIRIEVAETEPPAAGEGPPGLPRVPEHLMIDGRPVPVPEGMRKTIEAIYEDLGAIPSSYLTVADEMSGHYFHSLCRMPEGTGYFLSENAEGVHVLDEWDHRRQGYRKRWALLREIEASEESAQFAEETLARYRGVVRRIRNTFERLRLEQRLLRRQKEGDDVDLDAAVEAFSDFRAGFTPSERVFVRLRRDLRNIAAAFLIDLSGSTSGWINRMERAALLILSEALDVLNDRFSIYGFSGQTRKRCELYRIKGFDEPYGERVKRRIAGLRPLEYTRMGPPIRRLTEVLKGVEARTKLLVTLSDGKPDDYDGYNGEYGIEDTRQALIEAKAAGIHPFCVTIDKAEHAYLSHMYGPANYVFIDDLEKLPLKIPEIYRKLTT